MKLDLKRILKKAPPFYTGEVNHDTVRFFLEAYLSLTPKQKQITFLMDSHGGFSESGSVCCEIIDAIRKKVEVRVINVGVVGSAALDIFMMCDTRASFKTATFMHHKHSIAENRTMSQIDYELSFEMMSHKTLNNTESVQKIILPEKQQKMFDCGKDVWIYYDEAVKYGIINAELEI